MHKGSKPRVLVVDDDESIRALLKVVLGILGCEIAGEAEDGAKGLESYKQIHPDLTLLDISMPNMNGIETLKAILIFDPNAQVLMLTAVKDNIVAEDCILAGAKDYLRKDLGPEDMERRLREEINKFS
ncbi:MAG: response regulator [Rhodospirillales bacterium]